jgi:hypothetical protein
MFLIVGWSAISPRHRQRFQLKSRRRRQVNLMDYLNFELFLPFDFVDYSHGTSPKSTRTKDPKRKTIAVPQKECDRPSTAQTNQLERTSSIMPNFTTSANVLSYYCDTKAVRKLMETFGNRLSALNQEEKYQLCAALAVYLWGQCDDGTEDTEDEFSGLFKEDDSEKDLVETTQHQLMPEVSGNVKQALILLQYEDSGVLAQILPAITEYARDDDRANPV